MGEKVDADDEEEGEKEIFKETRHVIREFKECLAEAELEYGSSGINLALGVRKPEDNSHLLTMTITGPWAKGCTRLPCLEWLTKRGSKRGTVDWKIAFGDRQDARFR